MPKVATQALAGNTKTLQHGKSLWANLHLCWFRILHRSTSSFLRPSLTLWPRSWLGSCAAPAPTKPLLHLPPAPVFHSVCPSRYCCAGSSSITVVFSAEFSLACCLLYKTAAYLTVCPSSKFFGQRKPGEWNSIWCCKILTRFWNIA